MWMRFGQQRLRRALLRTAGLLLLQLGLAGCPPPPEDSPTPHETPSDTPEGVTPTPVLVTPTLQPTPLPDADQDGVADARDNCPETPNASQADADQDGTGDACDEETCDGVDNDGDGSPDNGFPDSDNDGLADCVDLCPEDIENDVDADGTCEQEDNCPDTSNVDQEDQDGDGDGDACDPCPQDSPNDSDQDGVCDSVDNCPALANSDQQNTDADLLGDACDLCPNSPEDDSDGDGWCGDVDNCSTIPNENQMDRDRDGDGDACDLCPDDAFDDKSDGVCGKMTSANPDGKFYIYNMSPNDGYQAVALSGLTGKTVFSQAYAGDPSRIHYRITSQYASDPMIEYSPALGQDKSYVYYTPVLKANTDYCITVSVDEQQAIDGRWPVRDTACFTTRIPCGVASNVGQDVTFVSLGASAVVVKTLNNALQQYGNDYPVVGLLEDAKPTTTFPFTAGLDVGGFKLDASGNAVLPAEGYTGTLGSCPINSSGALSCSADYIVIPIALESYRLVIPVFEAKVSATVVSSGNISIVKDFRLKGIVSEDTLTRLGSVTGFSAITAAVVLDVDLNGDGQKDAATAEVTSVPELMTLTGAACP